MSSLPDPIKSSRFAGTLKTNELTLAYTQHQLEQTVTKKQQKHRKEKINGLRFDQKKQKKSVVLLDGYGFKYPVHPNIHPYPNSNTRVDAELLLKKQELFLQTLSHLNGIIITILQRALTLLPEKKAEIEVAFISSTNIQIATLNTLKYFDQKKPSEKYLQEGDFLKVYKNQFKLAQQLEREIAAFEEAQKKENERRRIRSLSELAQRALK
jgi:hypothetical protein